MTAPIRAVTVWLRQVLRHNELESLPDCLECFSKLTSLVLEGNKLLRLPKSFMVLTRLVVST